MADIHLRSRHNRKPVRIPAHSPKLPIAYTGGEYHGGLLLPVLACRINRTGKEVEAEEERRLEQPQGFDSWKAFYDHLVRVFPNFEGWEPDREINFGHTQLPEKLIYAQYKVPVFSKIIINKKELTDKLSDEENQKKK